MVKSYLRYVPDRPFGVIATPNANVLLHVNGVWAITPAQEYIHIYQLQQGTLLHALTHLPAAAAASSDSSTVPPSVRVLCSPSQQPTVLAAGYDDGSIRLFSLVSLSCTLTLHGHTAAVTCLAFNDSGTVLLSGAADTALVCWDVVAQKGLVRLKGHKDAVTCVALLSRRRRAEAVQQSGLLAVSGSKDGSLRVWDLDGQYCRQSVLSDKEVWALAVSDEQSLLVSAGVDALIKVWRVDTDDTETETDRSAVGARKRQRRAETVGPADDRQAHGTADSDDVLFPIGALPRASSKRVVSVALSDDGRLLAVQSVDRMLEMWTVRTQQQIDKRKKSRRKRQQRDRQRDNSKQQQQQQYGEARHEQDGQQQTETGEEEREEEDEDADSARWWRAEDVFDALPPLLTEVKVASLSLSAAGSKKRSAATVGASHRLLLSLADNSLAFYNVNLAAAIAPSSSKPAATDRAVLASASSTALLYSLVCSIELAGHRSPIRTLGLSSDHSLLLSGSSSQLKLHSLHSQQCVRTLQVGSAALCCLFVPGNKHVVVGCKDGSIAWYELGSARCLGNVSAHEGHSVYSLHLRPDGRGFTSGGGDKCVRQWEFELLVDEASSTGGRILSIVLTRTLTLTDDVLCVRHSPNGKYIAAGLLDATIKLFHSDTLLFFLSLYGHRLPVLSIDFSSDCQLLASASADKNVKVWGVAFGDCQCSLFAHADTVTQVRFIPRTHYVASAGKDGMVKLWDADARQCIQELPGHTTEVWALEAAAAATATPASSAEEAVAGELIVSAGNDRSIRVWRQSDEILFVDEERDNRREALLDGRDQQQQRQGRMGEAEGVGQRVEVEGEMVAAAPTAETRIGAEGLLEAIDVADAEKQRIAAFHQQQLVSGSGGVAVHRRSEESQPIAELAVNPFLRGLTPSGYVLSVLAGLPPSSIDDCLQQLPFSYALRLMDCLSEALDAGEPNVELAVASLLSLLALHDRAIISNRVLLADMQRMRRLVRERLRAIKSAYGRNRAALQLLQKRVEEQRSIHSFA